MTAHMVMFQSLGGLTPIVVALTPTSASGSRFGAGLVVSNTITANATGGNAGTYTYVWSRQSGDAAISPTLPTAQATDFRASAGSNSSFLADFICTATDASGNGVSSAASVSLESFT